ncbi:MAG: hypothetical protein KJ052_11380 [Candidatus Hydrogenedentes bacterium]|nr:hypothetical protein [Candidatus Hydrogenedentota bacterium]
MTQHIDDNVKSGLNRLQRIALMIGAAGLVVLVLGLFVTGSKSFFESYLYGFIIWNGLALGCLMLLMVHHLTAGAWGFAVQRILEAGARTMPLTAILFLPLLFVGVYQLYPWVNAEAFYHGEHLHHIENKAWWLHLLGIQWVGPVPIPGWQIRGPIYFAIWLAMIYRLTGLSRRLDNAPDAHLILRMRNMSGLGLVVFALTITFAMVDWSMSLDPTWFSTIYAPQYAMGWGLAVLALACILMSWMRNYPPHNEIMDEEQFLNLGNLVLGFVVLWAYMSFSQFLIIWAGNLQEEVPWYLRRYTGVPKWTSIILIIFHFFIPFFILLNRRVKKDTRYLVKICLWILVMRLLDVFYIIRPEFTITSEGAYSMLAHVWMDLAAVAGFGGLWFAFFSWNLRQCPVLPLNDERMENAFPHREAHEHV